MLGIVRHDPWLKPYTGALEGRHEHALQKESCLTGQDGRTLADFALGHLYYGLHRTEDCWVFREWAPNAISIYLIGDFSDWRELPQFHLKRVGKTGDWEMRAPLESIRHGQHYKMRVYWEGGQGERIPAWCRRVVQDERTKVFSAQVWDPETRYTFRNTRFKVKKDPLLIYECHIGMAQEKEGVGTYSEFREKKHLN